MNRIARACFTVAIGSTLTVAALTRIAPATTSGQSAPRFTPAVRLTVNKYFGGYEPSVVVDRFNNVFVTAHKQNHSLVVSPDARSATTVRSQSWIWWSKDGATFEDMPGMTALQEQNLEFGDEGEVDTDSAGNLYFVDTNVVDVTFTRWHATGPGKLTLETTRPLLPAGEFVDDRPWITAWADGHVLYIGNEGDKASYPLGQGNQGGDNGPGRYTAYRSVDHGDTFDVTGYTLAESGWCRPARDLRAHPNTIVVMCTNDSAATAKDQTLSHYGPGPAYVYAYVSTDDGQTFKRYVAGTYNGKDPWQTYPAVSIDRNGTMYALYMDHETEESCNPVRCTQEATFAHLKLLTSKDGGKHWTQRDVTPQRGQMRYSWLDVAPDGTLAIAYYYRPNDAADWRLYAGTARPGQRFLMTSVDPSRPVASSDYSQPFGDFFEIAFGPDNKLSVVWTVQNTDLVAEGLNTDIYYARQR
jgi:hypothetical protein